MCNDSLLICYCYNLQLVYLLLSSFYIIYIIDSKASSLQLTEVEA